MRVVRHGKPAKAFTSRLRAATSDDYERLVSACLEAVIGGSTDVLVAFPYTLKFPEDFPRGILMERTDDGSNIHRIKAKKLLKWLNTKGYTDVTMESLRGQVISFGINATKLDEMLDVDVGEDLQC